MNKINNYLVNEKTLKIINSYNKDSIILINYFSLIKLINNINNKMFKYNNELYEIKIPRTSLEIKLGGFILKNCMENNYKEYILNFNKNPINHLINNNYLDFHIIKNNKLEYILAYEYFFNIKNNLNTKLECGIIGKNHYFNYNLSNFLLQSNIF